MRPDELRNRCILMQLDQQITRGVISTEIRTTDQQSS